MKSKTVFIVLGVAAVGGAAWWYLKNKKAMTLSPSADPEVKQVNVAPMPTTFPLKEPTINTLPNIISDFQMNTGNTGIVPPLVTTTTVKPEAIPSIAPPANIPQATAAVGTKTTEFIAKMRKAGLLGLGNAYSLN